MSTQTFLEETKTQIRCILVSNPVNMTIRRLNLDYLNLVGEHVPHVQLGYRMLIDFLRDIPDVVKIVGTHPMEALIIPVITENLAGLNNLIMKQRVTRRGPRTRRQTVMAPTSCSRSSSIISGGTNYYKPMFNNTSDTSSTVKQPRPLHKTTTTTSNPNTRPTFGHCQQNGRSNHSLTEYFDKTLASSNNTEDHKTNQRSYSSNKSLNKVQEPDRFFQKRTLPDNKSTYVNNNISKSSARSNSGNTKENSSTIGEKLAGTNNNVGTSSGNCFKDENEKYKIRIEKPTEISNNKKPVTPTISQPDLSHHISNKIRATLKDLIKSFPNGIRMTNLAYHYEKYCRKSLVYTDLGFIGALQFCLQLTDTFALHRLSNSGDFILFDATAEISPHVIEEWRKSDRVKNDAPKSIESTTPDSEIELAIPKNEICDMMGPCDIIESLWKTSKFVVGREVQIAITEIYDPVRFWFAIYDEDHFEKMNLVMDDMSNFYNETDRKHRIPKPKIQNNMYCAVYFAGSWQRILIIHPVGENRVKAYFVDYGTVAIVDISSLRYLSKTHQSLPKQAIRGRLDYIIPPNKETFWPIQYTREFIRRIKDKVLTVYITDVDEKDNIVWMVARYDNDPKNMTINEELVRKGHAVICPEKNCITKPINAQKRKYMDYLWPLFHHLEEGIAPNLRDLILLQHRCPLSVILSEDLKTYKILEHERTQIDFTNVNENKCGHFVKPNKFREAETEEEFAWLQKLASDYVYEEEQREEEVEESVKEEIIRVYEIGDHELHCVVYNFAVFVMTEEFFKKYAPAYTLKDLKPNLIRKAIAIGHVNLRLEDDEELFRALQRSNAPIKITDESVIHLTPLRSLDTILYALELETVAVSKDIKKIFEQGLQ